MKMKDTVKIVRNLPIQLRKQAIKIYYDAFAKKINTLLLIPKSKEQAVRIYEKNTNFESGLYALYQNKVVGLAGLNFKSSRFINLKWSTLFKEFGFRGALYRKLIFDLENLKILKKRELRIEALAVNKLMRGKGIGTLMLNSIFEYAKINNFTSVRLEVIDTNQGARKLYERMGFVATKTTRYGFLTRRAGFSAEITMRKQII